jgi:hypothetical protein
LEIEAFFLHSVHQLVAVAFITADIVTGQPEAPEMGQELAD